MGDIKHQVTVLLLALLLTVLTVFIFGLELWGTIGCFVTYIVVSDLFMRVDDNMPMGEIALFIGAIQWIIAPIVSYSYENKMYPMSVSIETYMSITIPIFLSFALGVYLFRRDSRNVTLEQISDYCAEHLEYAKLLFGVGLVLSFINIDIAIINFVKVLFSNLVYVGCLMYMYAKPDKATRIALGVCSFLFLRSIAFGAFHDLMVWGLFILTNLFFIRNIQPLSRLFVFSWLLVGVMFLQVVKPMYREQVWYGDYKGNRVELFFQLFYESISSDNKKNIAEEISSRFNQGWIISRIYSRIPHQKDFYEGKTIIEGVQATLLPRFLAPNKKGAGEQSVQDFRDFTGYNVSKNTSMGLSLLGESYGNFGLYGACLFMFLWGVAIQLLISELKRVAMNYNILWLLFIPLICFNIIKAEINFISVLNWSVKSTIFAAIVINSLPFIIKKEYDDTILPEEEGGC
ncbi:MAG: hypothetical protein SNI36_08885 [Rikenellaceae bacterium]